MDKVYLVVAHYTENIPWSVGMMVYICGMYENQLYAEERVDHLEKIVKETQDKLSAINDVFNNEPVYTKETMLRIEHSLDAVYTEAEEKLGFTIESRSRIYDEWDVEFEIVELSFGDIKNGFIDSAFYTE